MEKQNKTKQIDQIQLHISTEIQVELYEFEQLNKNEKKKGSTFERKKEARSSEDKTQERWDNAYEFEE